MMKIVDIRESGANNTLMWALSNRATLHDNRELMSLIDGEVHYTITIENVNQFELFRLTQAYRDKIRIESSNIIVPSREELNALFPGEWQAPQDQTRFVPYGEIAESVIMAFYNIANQMNVDKDIIDASSASLFFPMMCKRYTVHLPIGFSDIVQSMDPDDVDRIFQISDDHESSYPNTIKQMIESGSQILTILYGALSTWTAIIRYPDKYNDLVGITRYSSLASYKGDNGLYKLGLVGFSKIDPVSGEQVRCLLHKVNPEVLKNSMRHLSKLSSALELEVVVQLPIQFMQSLENLLGRSLIDISFESPITDIVETDIECTTFKTSIHEDVENDSTDTALLKKHNDEIGAYRVRIAEAQDVLLKFMNEMFGLQDATTDTTALVSLMPSLANTKAVLRINVDDLKIISAGLRSAPPILSDMFREIEDISQNVISDINSMK